MIQFEETNEKEFIRLLKRSPEEVKTAFRKALYISGKLLKKELVKELNKKGRSGVTYLIYKGRGGRKLKKAREHIASKPSEFPAVITGDYRSSIDFLVRGITRLEFGSGAKNKAEDYAEYLEDRNEPVGRIFRRLQKKIKILTLTELDKSIKKFRL